MTASLRGLLACTALLALLGLAWVLGVGVAARAPSPRLVAIDPARVQALRWQRDGREVLVVRRAGEGWQAALDDGRPAAPVRAGVVEDLLDVLAAGRWHRRAPAAAAGRVTTRLLVDGLAAELAIGVGEPLGEQRWLVVGERALLVDGWVARALELDPQQVIDRAALPEAVRSPVLEIHGANAPWRTRDLVLQGRGLVSPARRRLDPELARALRERLGALRLEPSTSAAADADAAGDDDDGDDARWSVRIAGGPRGEATLSGGGACAGSPVPRTRVTSSRLGAGCVDDVALGELAELIDRAASREGADTRLFAAAASELLEWTVRAPTSSGAPDSLRFTRAGGRDGDLAGDLDGRHDGGRWQVEREVDGVVTPIAVEPAAIEELLAELTTPWPLATSAPAERSSPRAPIALLTARLRDGSTIDVTLSAGRTALRDGEALGLAVPPALGLAPSLLATSLASRSLWQLEPTSIAKVQLGALALRRGVVLGEWLDAQGRALPARRAAALDELLRALGSLRARSRQPHHLAPRHRVSLWLDDDPGRTAPSPASPAAATHTLELSPLTRDGECLGRADGIEARFEPDLCAQVAALLR